MSHNLEAEYEGAHLRLNFTLKRTAALFINGIKRDQSVSDNTEITFNLASPVQTGYEQHEIIEGKVKYGANEVIASLHSGDKLIADETFPI